MTLLRIRAALADAPVRCQWALVNDGHEPVSGEGPLAALPRRAERVQLLVPAAQLRFTRVQLPPAARRRTGSVLAYAVEDETLGEPDAGQVSWLGSAGDADVLAVVDKAGLTRWRNALEAAGIRAPEVHCETLLLPWAAGEWSLAWDGREGFVRSGELEGATTDCGDRTSPPLSLRLMLEEAQARGAMPQSIAVYATGPDAAPDAEAWQRELGVAVRQAGNWDWRTAPADAGVSLAQERRRWRVAPGTLARLRPVAWIVAAALAVHALALVADWTVLARQQQALRHALVARFRATFPDAVAVVDPVLQMRRKLAEARHAAGQPDTGDFLPMIETVAAAARTLPAGGLRIVSYESGRMTLELAGVDAAAVGRIVTQLRQAGLSVDSGTGSTLRRGATVVLTVRAS
jgi:general secretion pathway protein L